MNRPKFKRRLADAREHAQRCDGALVEWDCGCSFRCMGDGCDCDRQCRKCNTLLRSDALAALSAEMEAPEELSTIGALTALRIFWCRGARIPTVYDADGRLCVVRWELQPWDDVPVIDVRSPRTGQWLAQVPVGAVWRLDPRLAGRFYGMINVAQRRDRNVSLRSSLEPIREGRGLMSLTPAELRTVHSAKR